MRSEYIVTFLSKNGELTHSSIWNPVSPFSIGSPLQAVLEKVGEKILFRDLLGLKSKEFSIDANTPLSIEEGSVRLKIASVRDLAVDASRLPLKNPELMKTESQTLLFKKVRNINFGTLAALLLLAFLIPKSKEDTKELIPEQYAKMILKPSTKKPENKAQNQSQAASGNAVAALNTTAVKNISRSLLKGGLSKMLSKGGLSSSIASLSNTKNLFQTNKGIFQNSGVKGLDHVKDSVQIGMIGGGVGNNQAGGVGYLSGEKGTVGSQGNSFVSVDFNDSQVEEGLSKDEVGKVIHAHIAEVRYCYESAMIKRPSIQGKLQVNFVIEKAGLVKIANLKESSLQDGALDQCIISRLKRWQFPKPKGGVDVAVTYPFVFKSLN